MRVAIIDLGTNAVRFDVHSLGAKGRLLHREKWMIRLGQGVFLKGKMDATAIERAVHAFQHFHRVAENLRAKKVVAFGTSALREAQDSALLLRKVKERTGIEITVISGKEEAELIALGILSNEKLPPAKFGLVDIGGGSTEISFCRGKRVLLGDSFPLGTARLQQVFLKKSPPKRAAVRQLREYVRNILGQKRKDWPQTKTIMGSSGTVRAIAKILGKKSFTSKELSKLVEEMTYLTTSELLHIPGMEPKRVDMILAGALLLEEIIQTVGANRIIPTEYSLRDGILEEQKRMARTNKSSSIELHLDDLFKRAAKFGLNEEHLRELVDFASSLYERLRPIHRLNARWKAYFLSAVILRRSGEIVSFAGREQHAYYLVKNSDFLGMQAWEHEFIAKLCLFHSGGKVGDLKELGKDKARKDAFHKILALVRVIDALDLGPRTTIRLKRVKISRKLISISYTGVGTAGIEQLMMERKKKLFEKVFGRQLVLERWKNG